MLRSVHGLVNNCIINMQLLILSVVVLLLERASSEHEQHHSNSSVEPVSEMSTTMIDSSTTPKPEVMVTFGDAYHISCSNGACRASESSVVYDDWLHVKKKPIFHSIMKQLIEFKMPETLVGDYHFGNEVLHIAGYVQDSHSEELTKKYYQHALKSITDLYKSEGTYYNHPQNQIFLCVNQNYSKPVLECTSAINTAYELCGKEHQKIKNNKGICKVPETFKTCEATMNVHIRKHCKVDPRPRFLEFVERLCGNMGTQRCGSYDSFYESYSSCLPIGMRKEFERIGGIEQKVLESFYKTGATFCNLFSSFLNGTFKEDHCSNLLGRYRCIKNRYQSEPVCRMRTEPLLKQYEEMCGKPEEEIKEYTTPPDSAGTTVFYNIFHTITLLLLTMLM